MLSYSSNFLGDVRQTRGGECNVARKSVAGARPGLGLARHLYRNNLSLSPSAAQSGEITKT